MAHLRSLRLHGVPSSGATAPCGRPGVAFGLVGLALGLLAALGGCGDDYYVDEPQDAGSGLHDAATPWPDGIGPGGEACPEGVGCPCATAEDCASALCLDATDQAPGQCAKPCETNGKAGCDDGNPCTVDTCAPSTHADTAAQCTYAALKNGAPCQDGNACSSADRCVAGACVGDLVVCDDGNPCTTDTCSESGGCVYSAKDGAACDDGSVCTTGDACAAGKCASGKPLDCGDDNPCTVDACDATLGCQNAPSKAACSDGNACTVGDACQAGACVSGAAVLCSDANPCTVDACVPAVGCTATDDDGASCSDGDVCTIGDSCKGGACTPTKTQSCDDSNPCTTDTCDALKGCVSKPADGAGCDDGTVCTVGDTCQGGACKPGTALTCDDGNPCTADACDAALGCQTKAADGKVCVPAGNTCDVGGLCAAGVCTTVKQTGCNDGNPCTTDTCDDKTGACVYTALADGAGCNDGSACMVGELCKKGACLGAPADCDDANPCTTDACDLAKGCTHVVASEKEAGPCDDGNLCTVGDVCGGGVCQPGKPQSCGDGNPCTDAACDPKSGCKPGAQGASCDDGNACTVGDNCVDGNCAPGAAQSCDDGNACTLDVCDPKKGCQSQQADLSCSDGNVCSVGDVCKDGTCASGKLQNCGDGNPCTTDSCDAVKGCVAVTNTASCDDGDVCTSNDICSGGKCASGVVMSCDDKNGCTDDTCDSVQGCLHQSTNNACDDGNKCTVGDGCKAGKCFPGVKQVCDDKNHCTTDSCQPDKGCVQTPNALSCDDGNVCSVADTCKAGKCEPGTKTLDCDDGVFCTDDFCDPQKGCNAVQTTRLCDDGDACTVKDACKQGVCVGGGAQSCDDLNKCTDDFCDAAKGCIHVDNGPNAFKPFTDTAQYNKDLWAFGATTVTKAFGHAGAGFYQMISGEAGSTQTMTLQEKVDLQCTGAPVLYWQERYAGGQLYVEASKDAKIWVPLAVHPGTADHVWRVNHVDLGQYKGIPVWIRLRAAPSSTANWWNIREIRLTEKDPDPPVVPWTFATACKHWQTEGPAWTCDKTTTPYQLRYQGVIEVPDPNGHANIARQHVLLDASTVKHPALTFEERSAGGVLYVDIRKPDGVWENIYTRVSLTDYVWRKRILYVGKYAGSKAQLRIRSTQASSQFGQVRNVQGVDLAPPGVPATQGVPSDLKDCGLWSFDGSAWVCNPSGNVWDIGWVGDQATEYNTNSYEHYANYGKRIDLTKEKAPVLSFDRRHNNGYTYLEISETKANWTIVWSTLAGSDYVWRPQQVDLSQYVGKVWYLRWRVVPYGDSYWGQIRGFKLAAAPAPLPVTPYGFTLGCPDWGFVGPSWKCDADKKPWFLRMDGVDALPPPGGYEQPATLQRWVDLGKASAPGFAFEYRRTTSQVRLQVSEDGDAWQELHAMSGATDHVWRKAHVDLGKFKGKKVMVRFVGIPGGFGAWGELRNVGFLDIAPTQSVPYTKLVPTCSGWDLEGAAWSCADASQPWSLRFDGQATLPVPNGYQHHARSKWMVDLTGAKKPTLYFDFRHHYGALYVTVDGPDDVAKQVLYEASSIDTVWFPRAVDLSAYAGRKIHITFSVVPGSPVAWGELKAIEVIERVTPATAQIGTPLDGSSFVPHGGWTWNPKTQRWHLSPTQTSTWHKLVTSKVFDLTKAKDPVLIYREVTYGMPRQIYAGGEDTPLEPAAVHANANDLVAHRRVISLAKWVGTRIHLEFWGYPDAVTDWWEVYDFEIVERPAVVKVAPGTVLKPNQLEAEGLWKTTTGGAWSFNHGVDGGDNNQILLPYYQSLISTVAFDVSKLKAPTLLFDERFLGCTHYIEVSADGTSWTTVWARSPNANWPWFWQTTAVDLTAHKGMGALLVRFRISAGSTPTYWQELHNITVAEKPVLPSAGKGYVVKPGDWVASGDWVWDAGNDWWRVTDSQASRLHHYTLNRTYAVGGAKSAKIVFESEHFYGYRAVDVSTDGLSWTQLYYLGGGASSAPETVSVDLGPTIDSAGANPQIQVRLRWWSYGVGQWWRVRKLSFQ